jgi:hypothetical protein
MVAQHEHEVVAQRAAPLICFRVRGRPRIRALDGPTSVTVNGNTSQVEDRPSSPGQQPVAPQGAGHGRSFHASTILHVKNSRALGLVGGDRVELRIDEHCAVRDEDLPGTTAASMYCAAGSMPGQPRVTPTHRPRTPTSRYRIGLSLTDPENTHEISRSETE